MYPIKISRHLQDGLHEHFERFAFALHCTVHKRLSKLLHFFGEQCCTIKLDHLQRAMDLMYIGQTETQTR